jgi:fatty acid desaturase
LIITDAAQNPAEELRRRQTRYIVMMLVRAGCLVLAAVLAMLQVPLLALWVLLCLVGAVILPWLAVILANDSGPRPEYKLANRFRREPPPPPAQRALSAREEPKVIDIDSD